MEEEAVLAKRKMSKKNENRIGGIRSKLANVAMILPYILSFSVFIIFPVALAIILSFTNFNSMTFPSFVGLSNYINLFTTDSVFMQKILPNTLLFALVCWAAVYEWGARARHFKDSE